MTDPVARPKIMNVKRIDFEKGSRGTLVGAEYHCEHGGDHTTVFRVLNAQQPSELTITVEFPYVGRIYRTDRVVREGTGTRIDTAVYWEEPKGIKLKVGALVAVRMMKKYFGDYDDRMDHDAAGACARRQRRLSWRRTACASPRACAGCCVARGP